MAGALVFGCDRVPSSGLCFTNGELLRLTGMSTTYSTLIESLSEAVASLQARPDYNTTKIVVDGTAIALTALVFDFNALKQACLIADGSGAPVAPSQLDATQTQVQALINANIAQMNMGQLSTSKTITTPIAKSQNAILMTLSNALMAARAGGGDTPVPPPEPQAWITGIEIEGMQAVSADTATVTYAKGGARPVAIEVLPPSAAAQKAVRWTGVTGTPPQFPVGTVSPASSPQTVTASLGDLTVGLKVYVLPQLKSLTASGVKPTAETGIYDASGAKTMTVTATTVPDTAQAWAYLQWSGGKPVSGAPNKREFDLAQYENTDAVPVTCAIDLPASVKTTGSGA